MGDLRALSEEEWWYDAGLRSLFVWPTYSLTTHETRVFTGMTWQSSVVVPLLRTLLEVDGGDVSLDAVGFGDTTGRRDVDSRVLPSEAASDEDAAVAVERGTLAMVDCRFDLLAGAAVRVAEGATATLEGTSFLLAKQAVATLPAPTAPPPELPCLDRSAALSSSGYFDDVGPYAMAGAALTYDGAGVCVAACDALRLAAAPGGGGGGASTGAC